MVIVDSKFSTGLGRPWRDEHAGRNWHWWELNLSFLPFDIKEVAIRKSGNEKQIDVLENICHRLNYLNDLTFDAHKLSKDIKLTLNTKFGSFPNE